ncbi:hypothetical protein BC940DRAFT_311563 [Gongronella butleri]|nr:hypothetical protein BC940DRAFT_311563 [Gongronella butleri]
MADFWVSQSKHWCKYCKKFVYNNKISIERHENGPMHKQNMQRHLSDIYKRGKQEKKDAESVRRELQRIEKAAQLSMGQAATPEGGIPASITGASSSGSITSAPKPVDLKAAAKRAAVPSTTPKAYIPAPPSLESLRKAGPKLQGRDEWALPEKPSEPEKIGNDDALVGQWQVVAPPPERKTSTTNTNRANNSNKHHQQNDKSDATPAHDQAPEMQDDDEDQHEDLSQFKIKEKEFPTDAVSLDDDAAASEPGASVFKKRKFGEKGAAARKKMTIRKKT